MANPFLFQSPWTPGPIQTSARTQAQWLAADGRSANAIYQTLLSNFPTVYPQALGVMAAQAAAFKATLDALSAGTLAGQIPRAQIPRNNQLTTSYRVIATARLRDPNAPPGSRAPQWTQYQTVVLDFTYNPTLRDIRDATRAMVTTTLPAAGSARAAALSTWRMMDFNVDIVERRT